MTYEDQTFVLIKRLKNREQEYSNSNRTHLVTCFMKKKLSVLLDEVSRFRQAI